MSQVIAAIDWVVAHRNDNGLNIKVIALAYGTDSVQDSRIDPLTFAVEQAWKAGITVVVAGGNDGSDIMNLANPGAEPVRRGGRRLGHQGHPRQHRRHGARLGHPGRPTPGTSTSSRPVSR